MAADLPPGRWSAVLVGPWWPAPSAALRAAAQHWATWAMQKQELARNLISPAHAAPAGTSSMNHLT